MGNTFFKYKQFTVHQEKCAQKVCTDTSLFGALIEPNNPNNVLDIGTGTGVLSLMIAQITEGEVTAIEIEKDAVEQAEENFKSSDWSSRLEVIQGDIKKYQPEFKFDLIISNPPFFQNSQKSVKDSKRLARHNDSLSLKELSICVDSLLSENGDFWVILPKYEMGLLESELSNFHFQPKKKIIVKNYLEDIKISRLVICFDRKDNELDQKVLAIYKDKNRDYTDEFVKLLKPYYLYL